MMIKLKPWDEVLELGKENGDEICDCVFWLSDIALPWGKWCYGARSVCGKYIIGGCVVKSYMVKEVLDDTATPDDILIYGVVITDDDMMVEDSNIRIRLISYDEELYYLKMQDGDVIECKRVGRANG